MILQLILLEACLLLHFSLLNLWFYTGAFPSEWIKNYFYKEQRCSRVPQLNMIWLIFETICITWHFRFCFCRCIAWFGQLASLTAVLVCNITPLWDFPEHCQVMQQTYRCTELDFQNIKFSKFAITHSASCYMQMSNSFLKVPELPSYLCKIVGTLYTFVLLFYLHFKNKGTKRIKDDFNQ